MANIRPTKRDIFDMFYQKRMVVRSGGGTAKHKMTRVVVNNQDMLEMKKHIGNDKRLLKYYIKLKDRRPDIAPPPRPA